MNAAIMATFMGTKKGVVTAVAIICPPLGNCASKGAANRLYILLANGNSVNKTSANPISVRNKRSRNSIKWLMKFSVGVTG